MVLSDKGIRDALSNRSIYINPFKKERINTSSYDVSLGKFYFSEQKRSYIHNPYNPDHVSEMWGKVKEAVPAKSLLHFLPQPGIEADDLVIVIGPGENFLCHTEEFIGGIRDTTSSMSARSTKGRNLILVCKCAGWGDVGYCNRWTMEVKNDSMTPQVLVVGRTIAQIAFFQTTPREDDENDYRNTGNYVPHPDFKEMEEKWHPNMMLPHTKVK